MSTGPQQSSSRRNPPPAAKASGGKSKRKTTKAPAPLTAQEQAKKRVDAASKSGVGADVWTMVSVLAGYRAMFFISFAVSFFPFPFERALVS